MQILLSAQEIRTQLQKIIKYYVLDESAKPRIDNILTKISDYENVDEYAQRYKNETDNFIIKISELMKFEREKTLNEVSTISDEILMAFIIRLVTIDDQLLKNPNTPLPISGDNDAFLCDCLIKYWQAYQNQGEVNLLSL